MTLPSDDPSDEQAVLVLAQDAIDGLLYFAEGRVLWEEALDAGLNELQRKMAGGTPAAPSE